MVNIYSGSCQDINQLTDDLSTYKQRFIMVKKKCQYLLPEKTLNISSPSVTTSQPSIAEKSNVQHENPAEDPAKSPFTGPIATVPEDPLSLSDTSVEQGDHSETKENLSNFQPEVISETAESTCKENVEHKQISLSNEALTRAEPIQQSAQSVESLCSRVS